MAKPHFVLRFRIFSGFDEETPGTCKPECSTDFTTLPSYNVR